MTRHSSATRPRGFSLVEFMVAITLALVVTAGVISVFVGSRSAFNATSGTAAVSDSGRFALTFLDNAVRDAGNMACGAPVRTFINVNLQPTPLAYTAGPAPALLFQPMGGYEAANTSPGNTYAASTAGGALGDWASFTTALDGAFSTLPAAAFPIVNNDILVTRSSTQGAQPAYVTALSATTVTVDTNPAGELIAPQMAIISDCAKSVVFQISSMAGNTITISTGGSPGNLSSGFPSQISFATGSQVTPLQTSVYFIALGADGDGALFTATVPSSNSLLNTYTELVPDIEAMQILYGLDTTGSQTVSEYVTANQVQDFTQVMSVKIALLAASPPGLGTKPAAAVTYNLLGTLVTSPPDNRTRQVFEATIAARNDLP
jgi:type IV pilus assembly protein PilW